MNIDFTNEPLFSSYVMLLLLSGVLMMGMGCFARTTTGMRVGNLLFGLGFLGYGVYLGFIFGGGTYFILFKVLFVPVGMIAASVRGVTERRRNTAAQAYHAQTQAFNQAQYQQSGQYPQQTGYPQAAYPQQAGYPQAGYPQQAGYAQPQMPQMPPVPPAPVPTDATPAGANPVNANPVNANPVGADPRA